AGSTSTASALLARGDVGAIALGERGDQAVDALGVDLLRELGAVGFHQPHTQHVEVVDLPAGAHARRLLQPVFELDRIAAAADLAADDDVGVGGRGAQRLHADALV